MGNPMAASRANVETLEQVGKLLSQHPRNLVQKLKDNLHLALQTDADNFLQQHTQAVTPHQKRMAILALCGAIDKSAAESVKENARKRVADLFEVTFETVGNNPSDMGAHGQVVAHNLVALSARVDALEPDNDVIENVDKIFDDFNEYARRHQSTLEASRAEPFEASTAGPSRRVPTRESMHESHSHPWKRAESAPSRHSGDGASRCDPSMFFDGLGWSCNICYAMNSIKH